MLLNLQSKLNILQMAGIAMIVLPEENSIDQAVGGTPAATVSVNPTPCADGLIMMTEEQPNIKCLTEPCGDPEQLSGYSGHANTGRSDSMSSMLFGMGRVPSRTSSSS